MKLRLLISLIAIATAQCPAGFSCQDLNTPQPCSAGTFSPQNQQNCSPCPPFHYCLAQAAAGTPCPPGTFDSREGLKSHTECGLCPAGSFCSTAPTTSPVACITTQGSVAFCPAGSLTSQPCPAGYFCPSASQITPCPNGTFNSQTGQSAETACRPCSQGHACPAASTSQQRCSTPALYQPQTGQAACTPCPAGQSCSSSLSASVCPQGSSSDEGVGICSATSSNLTCELITSQLCRSGSSLKLCPSFTRCRPEGNCKASRFIQEVCSVHGDCISNRCMDGVCIRGKTNALCASSEGCPLDSYCSSTSQCANKLTQGATCSLTPNDQCFSGGVCRPQRQCLTKVADESACQWHNQCVSGWCLNGKCTTVGGRAGCSKIEDCASHLTCPAAECTSFLSIGSPCTLSIQCASEACVANKCAQVSSFACDSSLGSNACQYPGESCVQGKCLRTGFTDWPCKQLSDCNQLSHFCNSRTNLCTARLQAGGSCSRDYFCEAGLECANGQCAQPVQSAALSCIYDSQCTSEQYCSYLPVSNICTSHAKLGQICSESAQCEGSLACVFQNQLRADSPEHWRCAAPLSNGELCKRNSECAWPLFCSTDQKCQLLYQRKQGQSSTDNQFCSSGFQFQGKCARVVFASHPTSPHICSAGDMCLYDIFIGDSVRIHQTARICRVRTGVLGNCPLIPGTPEYATSLLNYNHLLSSQGNSTCHVPDLLSSGHLMNEFKGCVNCRTSAQHQNCVNTLKSLYETRIYNQEDAVSTCVEQSVEYWQQSDLILDWPSRVVQPQALFINTSANSTSQLNARYIGTVWQFSDLQISVYSLAITGQAMALLVALVLGLAGKHETSQAERGLQVLEEACREEERQIRLNKMRKWVKESYEDDESLII